jgi:CubicO group peptidase (beta-lactamase class C family)
LKTYFFILLTIVVGLGCNNSSGEKKQEDDSLQYYPPTPKELDKAEYRHLYRDISGFLDTALLQNHNFNGGILIAKNGSVVYEKYAGLIDRRTKDSLPITDSTSMHVASTSKTFTAVAILRLVQQNKLSLNDTITKFFPNLPYKNITVKMLLNHRSGLPNYLYYMTHAKWGIQANGKWNRQFATNSDVLEVMINKKPDPTGKVDERFTYCNTNYVLLALIIEKITGISFPDYLQETIFGPLQMKHSFVYQQKDTARATPTFTWRGAYWDMDFLDVTYGDKNIYTTPRDLLKWDQALYTEQLVSKPLLDSAFAPYSFEKPSVHNYGLGWRLQILPNGKKVVYHFGKWHGSNAAFGRLIDEKATIIIIGNRFTNSIYNAAQLCYDIFGDYQQRFIASSDEIDTLKMQALKPPPKKSKKKEKR